MRPDFQTLDEITRKLVENLPPGIRAAREDLEARFRSILEAGLNRMDLVTREEFEIQKRVLERTREKLEALEKRLDAREADSGAGDS